MNLQKLKLGDVDTDWQLKKWNLIKGSEINSYIYQMIYGQGGIKNWWQTDGLFKVVLEQLSIHKG